MAKMNKGAIMGPILSEFGIKKIDDAQLLAGLVRAFGPEEGSRLYEEFGVFSPAGIDEQELEARWRAKEDPCNQTELYDFENSSLQAGMLFTAYADADVISAFSQWLYDRRSHLGEEILDVGCGNGILTAFLARLCPQAHIIGLDRSARSIAVANEVKNRLKLENVDFISGDLSVLQGRRFHTVLSLRTLHENVKPIWTPFRFLPFSQQLQLFRGLYHGHVAGLCSLVAEGGCLLAVERLTAGVPLLSWLQEMQSGGFFPSAPVQMLSCRETNLTEPTRFPALILHRDPSRSPEDVFSFWSEPLFGDPEDPRFWPEEQVDYELEQLADCLLTGYASYTPQGVQCVQCCTYSIKNDLDHFLLYQADLQTKLLGYFSNSRQDEALALLTRQLQKDRRDGYTIRPLG